MKKDPRFVTEIPEWPGEDDDFDDVGPSPEPLRLSMPINDGEKPSLVLAAAAVEDYDEDDGEWADDGSDFAEEKEIPTGIQLPVDPTTTEDISRLEERRSFKAPVWGPRPGTNPSFDDDISLFDESDEDDAAFGQKRAPLVGFEDEDDDVIVFDEMEEPEPDFLRRRINAFIDDDDMEGGDEPLVAAVRIGPAPEDEFAPEPLLAENMPEDSPLIEETIGWEDSPVPRLRPEGEDTEEATMLADAISPEEERTQIIDRSLFDEPLRETLIEERPRNNPRPSPEQKAPTIEAEEGGGSSFLLYAIGLLLLLAIGAAGIFVYIDELSSAGPSFDINLFQTDGGEQVEETPPEETTEPPTEQPTERPPEQPTEPPPEQPTEPVKPPPVRAGSQQPTEVIELGDPAQRLVQDTGKLSIITARRSTVYIDGRRVGVTPMAPVDLTPGTHDIKVIDRSTGRAQYTQVRVDAGRLNQVGFK
ncbi:MAG: PEGA domain-containing protein [Myxococcota bacterium]